MGESSQLRRIESGDYSEPAEDDFLRLPPNYLFPPPQRPHTVGEWGWITSSLLNGIQITDIEV